MSSKVEIESSYTVLENGRVAVTVKSDTDGIGLVSLVFSGDYMTDPCPINVSEDLAEALADVLRAKAADLRRELQSGSALAKEAYEAN